MGYQDFFDREGRALAFAFWDTGSAPAGLTVRFTYTVPAGKAALITLRTASIMCRTAAAPRAFAAAYHRSNLSVGGLREGVAAQGPGNVAGDNANMAAGVSGPIKAGDILEGVTLDSSTGGFLAYGLGLEVLEFDRKIT